MSYVEVGLVLDGNNSAFEPAASVSGVARWSADRPPASVEVRLFWYTRGEGTKDLSVVDVVVLPGPQAVDRRPFSVVLPPAPPTFRGKLVELVWAIEVVALPSDEAATREIVVGPGGRAVDLASAAG